MADKYTLYFMPGSYYSMKALLACYEKGVPFASTFVNIHGGENTQPWYLKIHPKGKVPALRHGDVVTIESERIIDYVDKHNTTGPRFVPDLATPGGKEVEKFRRLLDDIRIDIITFGVGANVHLSVSGLQVPESIKKMFNRKRIEEMFKSMLKEAAEKAVSEPENSDYWSVKKTEIEARMVVLDSNAVAAILDDLEGVFDQLEEQLQSSRNECMSTSDTFYLVGKSYTAADITTTCLFHRLTILGLLARYTTKDKRPLCYEYSRRLLDRPSVKKADALRKYIPMIYMKTRIKKMLPAIAKLGTVAVLVGATAYVCQKFEILDRLKGYLN